MTPSPTEKILIVDDDVEQVVQLELLLRGAGYETCSAHTGREAVQRFRTEEPGLVLLDVNLPDTDGFALCVRLRREAHRFVPIVLLTGYGDPDSKRRGVEAGADEFLQKPISPFELELRLRSLLRIKALTDELAERNRRLFELARRDVLCGVPNRRALLAELRREVRRAARYDTALSVLIFDLDHFKRINDRYGHAVGDQVLRTAARVLADGIRRDDTVGRLGGEEFLVVAPHSALEEAVVMAERLRAAVARRATPGPEEPIHVTVSVGVAARAPGSGLVRAMELLERADRALYAAKAHGRDQVRSAPDGSPDLAGELPEPDELASTPAERDAEPPVDGDGDVDDDGDGNGDGDLQSLLPP